MLIQNNVIKRQFLIKTLIFLFFCLLINNISHAEISNQSKMFLNIFPIGTEVYCLAVDPVNDSVMYALTYQSLYKSTNDGRIWQDILPFEKDREVTGGTIRFDPTNSNIVFVGINSKSSCRLLKSIDGGESWKDISGGVIKSYIRDVAIDSSTSTTAYVVSGGELYKTFNGGKSWGNITPPNMTDCINSISINPENHLNIVTCGERVGEKQFPFFSYDGGMTWEEKKYTFKIDEFPGNSFAAGPAEPDWWSYFSFMQPNRTGCLLAGAGRNGWKPAHFLFSSDNGITWNDISPKDFIETQEMFGKKWDTYARQSVFCWSFLPNSNHVIFAGTDKGLYVSENDGDKWKNIPFPSPDGNKDDEIWDLHAKSRNTIYIVPHVNRGSGIKKEWDIRNDVGGCGIYVTLNGGEEWLPRYFGLPSKMSNFNLSVGGEKENRWLSFLDPKSNFIFVGDWQGYWKSDNNGFSWQWYPTREYGRGNVMQLVSSGESLYALIGIPMGNNVIIKSVQDKKPYKLKLPSEINICNIGLSSSSSEIIYAVSTGSNLLKSEDGGFSWKEVDWRSFLADVSETGSGSTNLNAKISLLEIAHRFPNILYLILDYPVNTFTEYSTGRFGLLKTTDGGKTWQNLTNNLAKTLQSFCLLLIKQIGQATFQNLSEKFSFISSSDTDPSNPNVIYVTTLTGGVYYSKDGGENWSPKISHADPLFQKNVQFYEIVLDKTNTDILYLATSQGLYISYDKGGIWRFCENFGETPQRILTSSSLVLVAGKSGIYRLSEMDQIMKEYEKFEKPISSSGKIVDYIISSAPDNSSNQQTRGVENGTVNIFIDGIDYDKTLRWWKIDKTIRADSYLEGSQLGIYIKQYSGNNCKNINIKWTGDIKNILDGTKAIETCVKEIKNYKQKNFKIRIVSHSWGTVIGFRAIKELETFAGIGQIDEFITAGSPLYRFLSSLYDERHLQAGLMQNVYIGNLEKPGNLVKWVNFWAKNDWISGPIEANGIENIQVDKDAELLERLKQKIVQKIPPPPKYSTPSGISPAELDMAYLNDISTWHSAYCSGVYNYFSSIGEKLSWDIPSDITVILGLKTQSSGDKEASILDTPSTKTGDKLNTVIKSGLIQILDSLLNKK